MSFLSFSWIPKNRRRWRVPTVAVLVVLTSVLGLFSAFALPFSPLDLLAGGGDTRPTGGTQPSGGQAPPSRPLAINQTEAFGEGQVLVLSYPFSYYCPTEAFDDLDPPNNNGNGIAAAADPAEFQVPQCVLGDDSLPTVGPNNEPIDQVEKVWVIVPYFDGIPANAVSSNLPVKLPLGDLGNIESQCPEPGPPITQRKGLVGTCTMHPSILHAGHANLFAGQGVDTIPLANHSHILDGTDFPFIWWQVIGVLVTDRSVWPDHDGNCPAGRDKCLTSLAALRTAQANNQARSDSSSNLFLFFDSRKEVPQPGAAQAAPSTEAASPAQPPTTEAAPTPEQTAPSPSPTPAQSPTPTPAQQPTNAGPAPRPASPKVTISDFMFSPADISASVGATVEWTNAGPTTHTVTSDTKVFDSGNLSKGGRFSHTFNQAGTFNYFCSIHPTMKGRVVVTQAATQAQGSASGPSSAAPTGASAQSAPSESEGPARATDAPAPAPPALEATESARPETQAGEIPATNGEAEAAGDSQSENRSTPARTFIIVSLVTLIGLAVIAVAVRRQLATLRRETVHL